MQFSQEERQRYALKLMCMIECADAHRALATDPTFKVGCVIFPLDCSSVLSIGYNGPPRGMPHARPDIPHATLSGSGMCHAELNALTKLDAVSAPPCLLFVHTTPCKRCAAQIINCEKIIGLLHEDDYHGDDGEGRRYIVTAGVSTVHRDVIHSVIKSGQQHDVLDRWHYASHMANARFRV